MLTLTLPNSQARSRGVFLALFTIQGLDWCCSNISDWNKQSHNNDCNEKYEVIKKGGSSMFKDGNMETSFCVCSWHDNVCMYWPPALCYVIVVMWIIFHYFSANKGMSTATHSLDKQDKCTLLSQLCRDTWWIKHKEEVTEIHFLHTQYKRSISFACGPILDTVATVRTVRSHVFYLVSHLCLHVHIACF